MNELTPRVNDSDIKRVTRKFHGKEYKFPWRGLDIIVKKLLSPKEVLSLYKDTIEYCSYKDGEEVMVPLLDLSFRVNIIKYYTNIDLPSSIDEINYVLYETDLFECIVSHINEHQFQNIKTSLGL